MKTEAGRYGDTRRHPERIAALEATNRRLRLLVRLLTIALNKVVAREVSR